MNRQKVKRQNTKEIIINTTKELFYSIGYENTTIDLILEKANIAKGTFYYNFKSKEEILEIIAQDLMLNFEQEIKSDIENNIHSLELIDKIIYQLADWAIQNPEINKALIIQRFSIVNNTNFKHNSSFRKLISYVIKKAQDDGLIRIDINNFELSQMLGMMIFQAMINWHSDPSINLKEKFKNCLDVFFSGAKL